MWSVIRKAQGLPPNESAFAAEAPAESYARNQRCILMHAARPDVPPLNPRTMTRSYGDFHYDKIRCWLLDEDPHVRLQAADQLVELYTERREHRARSLNYDMLPILVSILCTDTVEAMREQAATALELLVREHGAQQRLLQPCTAATASVRRDDAMDDPLQQLLTEALGDPSDTVVVLALRVLVACHAYVNNFAATARLVELGEVSVVLQLIAESPSPLVRAVACSALALTFDVKEAHIIFQKMGGMRIATDAVRTAEDDMLVAEAAEVIARAAEWPQGKRDAVTCETAAALLPRIFTSNLTARVAVVAALAQITVWEPAKQQCLETDEMTTAIARLLAEEDERDVIAHLVRLLYHLAEHPAGRAALRPSKSRLEELLGFADADDLPVRLALENGVAILSRK